MMVKVNFDAETLAVRDYQNALGRAFRRRIRQWLGRGCNDLLQASEVLEYLKDQPHSEPVLMDVPTAQIVGSSGRARDFDLAFYPRRRAEDNRWVNIARAKRLGASLPPVSLFNVGQAYFVEDGNHRVSVARARGEEFIKARVVEIDPSVLRPAPECTRLGYKLGRLD